MKEKPPGSPLGAEIREIRKALGFSLEEMGKAVGVSLLSIHRWEAGKNSPHKSFIKKIKSLRNRIPIESEGE